ncbi:NB-ARC domain-containing protein [Streptomyces griseoflavus]|uniref:NB-ARC domain-containing protein n=1 Tax=Streptomyces griseoflavus TaxID=35619 RepID=UPI0038095E4C
MGDRDRRWLVEFCTALNAERERAGLTQRQLAKRLQLSEPTISALFNARIKKAPSWERVRAVLTACRSETHPRPMPEDGPVASRLWREGQDEYLHRWRARHAALEIASSQPSALPQQTTQKQRASRPAADEAARPEGVPSMPIHFVGRDREMGELKERLTNAERPQLLTAVRGWPGVGKTTVAAQLAVDRTFIENAFPDGVLWASVPDGSHVTVALASWIRRLGLPRPNLGASSGELTSILKCALRDRRVLLIVDDVWNPAHVVPFNVGGPDCVILITTRLPQVAHALATPADIYPLGLLSEEAALELLRRLAPEVVHHHPDEARALVRTLERLPLAVRVAGQMLSEDWANGWGIDDMLAQLREGSALLAAAAPIDRAADNHTIPTVRALLRMSTDRLDRQNRLRFAFLGAFASQPAAFDVEAMADVWGVADAVPTIRVLVALGLLEPSGDGWFTMHALLVLHAKALLREGK